MSRIVSMAIKDLKILLRDRTSAFFIIGFPILMGLFFGSIMGNAGGGGKSSAMKVAIVDLDESEPSKRFVGLLKANSSLDLIASDIDTAKNRVRKGNVAGMITIVPGFGEKADVFWNEAPEIQMGVDPSRNAEAAMLRGHVMESLGAMIGDSLNDPKKFRKVIKRERDKTMSSKEINLIQKGLYMGLLDSVDSMVNSVDQLQTQESNSKDGQGNSAGGFQFANITDIDVTREVDPKSQKGQLQKIRSSWDISFPQAMLWGILGCVAGFSASIARENTVGTMTRLQAAPMSRFSILAGKALACFMAVVFVITMMTLLGHFLGMRSGNFLYLAIASLAVAICFVGIMMALSVVGKTEQAVSGIGWMANMVMAMFGGCMIPVMFMPNWIRSVSVLSPVRWAITAIEGAIWRDFSFAEMMLPCGILVLFGLAGVAVGTTVLSKRLG